MHARRAELPVPHGDRSIAPRQHGRAAQPAARRVVVAGQHHVGDEVDLGHRRVLHRDRSRAAGVDGLRRPRPRRARCRAPAAGRAARRRRAGSSSRRRRRRRATLPSPGTSSGTSSASTKLGTPSSVTRSQRPSRHVATVRTSPAAVSSTTSVSGSVIGTAPVSSSAVTTQIVFEPLIACARSGCRITKPACAAGSVDANTRLALVCGRPRGSKHRNRRSESSTSLMWWSFSRIVAPGTSNTPPRKHVPCSPSACTSTPVTTSRAHPHQAGASETASAWSSAASSSAAASSVERQQRLADGAASRCPGAAGRAWPSGCTSPLSMFCTHGRMPSNSRYAVGVVARVGGVHDRGVMARQHVRRAGQPGADAPREVVDGLVVGAAHDRRAGRRSGGAGAGTARSRRSTP